MNKNLTGVLFALISAAGFAVMGISGVKAYQEGISTYNLLAFRFLVSFLLLLSWFLIFRRERLKKIALVKPLLLGAIGYSGQAFLYFTTIKYLATGITATLLYTYPSIVAILTLLFDRIKPTKMVMIGILLSFVGIVLIADFHGSFSINGLLLGLMLAIWYSGYIKVSERFLKNADTFETSLLLFLGAGITFSSLAIIDQSFFIPTTFNQWLPILTLAIFSTLVAISFFFVAIKNIGSVKASIISTLEPVITILIGLIILNESITVQQASGMALVLASMLISIK